jgi:hypothetical protein
MSDDTARTQTESESGDSRRDDTGGSTPVSARDRGSNGSPPTPRLVGYLDIPCESPKWFVLDLLGVTLVCALVLGGLFLFQAVFARVFLPEFQQQVTPPVFFVGNAIAPMVATVVLSVALTMVFAHVRYLVAQRGSFWLYGVLGLLLVLFAAVLIGLSMFWFYSNPVTYQRNLRLHGGIQLILVVVVLYFSAVLKAELMKRLYDYTIHAGIARLHLMKEQGNSTSDVERSWLDNHRSERQLELNELDRLRREHDDHFRS